MDKGSGVVDKGSSVVDRGVVDSHGSIGGGVVGHGSGGVDSSHRLLVVAVAVHRLGRGVGLARHGGVVGAVGLVDGHGDGGGVANLDDLVVGLVGGNNGQQGSTDKSLNRGKECKYYKIQKMIQREAEFVREKKVSMGCSKLQ